MPATGFPVLPVTPLLSTSPRRRRRDRQLQEQDRQQASVNAASYSRFSSNLQREDSLADQQRKCRDQAAQNHHALPRRLEFEDAHVSGTKRNRDGLNAMLSAAERGEFQVLYLFSLSRLARESVITMPLLKRLVHRFSVRIIAIVEGIDSSREGWELQASILSSMHEQYLRDLRTHVLRGHEGTLLSGYSVGDWCFGYRSEPVPGTEQRGRGRQAKPRMRYIIDPVEAEWVRKIFAWYVEEKRSISWIVRSLNQAGAPKDRRSSSAHWHHSLVSSVLSNPKYVGIWKWGEMQNRRDPETGDTRQVPRPDDETEKWIRCLPELRIIDDATFAAAQQRLTKNVKTYEKHRRQSGQLRGSSPGSRFGNPVHLLSGLLTCAHCGARLVISGWKRRFFFCPASKRGQCHCKTQLPVSLAEKMILGAISARLTANGAWVKAVLDATEQAWQRFLDTVPAELESAEASLQRLRQRIARLLDQIEDGLADPGFKQRLRARREEETQLLQKIQQLSARRQVHAEPPSREWVEERLSHLGEVLAGPVPSANQAIKNLVGGQIELTCLPRPNSKRFFWQGRMRLSASHLAVAIEAIAVSDQPEERNPVLADEIVLDFLEEDPAIVTLMQRIRADYDAGMRKTDLKKGLRVSDKRIDTLLQRSFLEEGRDLPAAGLWQRGPRQTGISPSLEAIVENVMSLWRRNLSMKDIASTLAIRRDQVTIAVQYWHHLHGLPVPDGRARRKQLRLEALEPSTTSDHEN